MDPLTGGERGGVQPPPPADGAGSFFGLTWWTASNMALTLASIAIITGLLIAFTVHTDVWSGFSDNHVTSAEREQILGPIVAVDSLSAAGTESNLPVLSDVIVRGDLIIQTPSTTTVSRVNVTEVTQINGNMTSPRIGNGTVDIIEYITIIDDTCSPEDFSQLLSESEMLLLQIQTETPLFFVCPANLSAILVALQQNNSVTTLSHTARLEAAANASCNATSQQAQDRLNRLVIINVELDVTENQNNITRDELVTLNMVLDGLEASYPGLINATCSYNATLFINTQQTIDDQRTILNGTNDLLNIGTGISNNCAAVMANVTLAIDGYNSTLTSATVTFNTLNGTYTEYRQNLTLYENQHTLLRQELQANNASLLLLQNNYTQCLADTALLQSRLDALWQRYQMLRSTYTSQNMTYTELDVLFRTTYALLNATEGQCATAQAQLDALLTSINTLYAQYLTEYNAYQLTINSIIELQNNASLLEVRITVLELNVVWLFGNITDINGILDTINVTLISVADDVSNTTLTLDQVNNTLVTTDNAINVVENGVVVTNATLVTTADRTTNQTAEIIDHQIRIDALEAAGCPAATALTQVASDVFVAGQDMLAGTVARIDPIDGQVYPASGFFIKDAYLFGDHYAINTMTGQDEIQGTPRSAVDASDHFYSVYQVTGASAYVEIDGFNVTNSDIVVLKFSPIHEILWSARIGNLRQDANAPTLFIVNVEIDHVTNTVVIVGNYRARGTTTSATFINADGSDSGFELTGLNGLGGQAATVPFFGRLSATGVWLNAIIPDAGNIPFGCSVSSLARIPGAMMFVGSCLSQNNGVSVTFPGGIVLPVPRTVGSFATWGRFEVETFTFTYVRTLERVQPFPFLSTPTPALYCMSVWGDSGDSAFIMGGLSYYAQADPLYLGYNTTVPGESDTFIVPLSSSEQSFVMFFMRVDANSGGVVWITATDRRTNVVGVQQGDTTNSFPGVQPPDITVDHGDNPWFVFTVNENSPSGTGINITYQGHSFGDTRFLARGAFLVLRLSAIDGQFIDGQFIPIVGNAVGGQARMAGTFVTSGVGDLFLTLSFECQGPCVLEFDGVEYGTNWANLFDDHISSVFVKYNGIDVTAEAVYLDDYGDASIALDSHGNLWSFLSELREVPGDSRTLGFPPGLGIVKLGQHNIEPFGVVGHNVTIGDPVRVVFEGVITMPEPHGYPVATQLYNDEGALVDNVPYGSTKVATVISDTDILVQIHRPMINQRII